jgi:hypothetical protein
MIFGDWREILFSKKQDFTTEDAEGTERKRLGEVGDFFVQVG